MGRIINHSHFHVHTYTYTLGLATLSYHTTPQEKDGQRKRRARLFFGSCADLNSSFPISYFLHFLCIACMLNTVRARDIQDLVTRRWRILVIWNDTPMFIAEW